MSNLINWLKNIKKFFSNIFVKPKIMIESSKLERVNENDKQQEYVIDKDINVINKLKKDNKKNKTTEEIIYIIENNPIMLKDLNMRKLDIIENYYRNKIVQTEENVKKAKNNITEIKEYINSLDEKICELNTKKIS